LPLAGIDGTLHSRMQSTQPGSARLKTGHLDGVSGIAGYVTGASGKVYVVVSLVNDSRPGAGVGDSVHNALVGWTQAAL
jgi:D-alanyl-D-alanine carboxypeptidase/D-alanyl-D-alanine-endopeptidase (penicillin-binding protein 4)